MDEDVDKMQVNINYFVHGTTLDNEKKLSSGWHDVELSEVGIRQSNELKELVKDKEFDVVFCSDLKRAVASVEIVFGDRLKIIQDKRLRECDYGDRTREKSEVMNKLMFKHIAKPFRNGESYQDVENRIRSFLEDLLKSYIGRNVAIVAHRAPQLALEVILKGKTWEQAMKEDWRLTKSWQPGFEYQLYK
jgi:alpha-ribazole phosphatase/probable phosphoglycerate mutase